MRDKFDLAVVSELNLVDGATLYRLTEQPVGELDVQIDKAGVAANDGAGR